MSKTMSIMCLSLIFGFGSQLGLAGDRSPLEAHLEPLDPGQEEIFLSNPEHDVIFVPEKLDAFSRRLDSYLCACVVPLPKAQGESRTELQLELVKWRLRSHVRTLGDASRECSAQVGRFLHRGIYASKLKKNQSKDVPVLEQTDETSLFGMNFPILSCGPVPLYLP